MALFGRRRCAVIRIIGPLGLGRPADLGLDPREDAPQLLDGLLVGADLADVGEPFLFERPDVVI